MVYLSLFFTLPLLFCTDGGALPTFGASNQTKQLMRKASRRETPILPPPYLQLPVFVDSRLPLVEKEHFSPSKGTGQEPLPEPVREVLLPVRPQTSQPSVSGDSVRTSCKRTKMLVQVDKNVLGTVEPQSRVKLGTCPPSKATRDYLYFEYGFDMCGTKQTIFNNQMTYLNTLQYDPPTLQGPIRRSAPFSLPVSCNYNRYQYSYKIAYKPKLRMRKIFKPMRQQIEFVLTPRNAQWERLFPSDHYVLGKPMYFEAEGPSMSQDERLYVHLCYATPEKSHTSMPQFEVVKNFGCMSESKEGRSRFIPYKNNVVRFSVDAFLFKGMKGQLYMHCSMSVGSSIPTPTAKSCNYDTKAKRWVELYGKDSVCACCDSSCNSAASTVTKMVSSRPWTIETKVKPTKVPKRKTVFTTTSTTTEAGATPQPYTTAEVTHWKTTEMIEDITMGKVESAAEELEWPFGGEGVKWVEFEEEEQVKGSAVVVEEEEEEEVVTQPRLIFEEIFDFGE
ncbi:zona pellucida sperm-binding protein 3d.2 isoform X2 [Cheilinus undulatus]|uniref:zona pellucida sperm-binding protein 3d.2 isoform X2 n=1 Tax=Cheilinus undulatus TaxID=241271 RepID=UPI001BD6773A|nr:zona pellucida sperm-binding protein 3d.2 isoform X2 [Cheilinus undulatus]